jgi:REP element-mobilizing transposase RayT
MPNAGRVSSSKHQEGISEGHVESTAGMRRPYTQLYLHLVWSTWDRQAIISPAVQSRLYACIRRECADLNGEALAIGGMTDHVHLLVRMPATLSVADLIKQVKGSSSHLATHEAEADDAFRWQGSYGAFTISKSHVERIKGYILRQEEHHRAGTTHKDLEETWDDHPPHPADVAEGSPG